MTSPEPSVVRRLLRIAVAVVTVEALAVIGFAVADLGSLSDGRLALGVSAGLFLLAYGIAQLVAGVVLLRGRWGARGPIIASQLIQLGIAWNLRGVEPDALLVPRLGLIAAVLAAIVLACLLAPPVTRAIVAQELAELGDQPDDGHRP